MLGNKALTLDRYVPDYTAEAIAPCRILILEKAAYQRAVQQARLGLVLGGGSRVREAMRKSTDTKDKGSGQTNSRFFAEKSNE